jgi:hypothetical protein
MRRVGAVLVSAGACLDIVENVCIATKVSCAELLPAISSAKWGLLGFGALVVAACARRCLKAFLREQPKALYSQRYSVLIVLPLTLLSLSRGPDLLEQIPDIQRRWSDNGNAKDFLFSGIVMFVLGVLVLSLGRQRANHLRLRVCPRWTVKVHPCRPDADGRPTCPVLLAQPDPVAALPSLRLWLLGPVVIVGVGLLLDHAGAAVVWPRVWIFVALPLIVATGSFVLRQVNVYDPNPTYRVRRPPIPVRRYLATARTGDALVGALPLIAGLGCIRAFVGPLALDGLNWRGHAFLWAGVATVLVAYPALTAFLAWARGRAGSVQTQLASPTFRPGVRDRVAALLSPGVDLPPALGGRVQWIAWSTLLLALVGIGLVGSLPAWLATHAGVIATFQLALGSLCALIAATVIIVQRGEGPELFWKLGISYAPVTSLLVAVSLAVGLIGHWSKVHEIRPLPASAVAADPAQRPDLATLFTNWLAASGTCAQRLGDTGYDVRPLMLYAAEGGGIRAAYWTAAGIDWIRTGEPPQDRPAELAADRQAPPPDPCRSAMLSSGASGGSVGLSIASVLGSRSAAPWVRRIAGRRALGSAAVGLVLRDTIYSATGLPLPSYRDRASRAYTWSDRGSLIEESWEHFIPQLRTPFLTPEQREGWRWGTTGALVVNSTSTTTSCRMLVSQIRLENQGADCGSDSQVAGSADLLSCTGDVSTTTAALLTARFPYVTPSGVVTCPGRPDPHRPGTDVPPTTLQIVDGGYGDNFGVGTLVDLGPELMNLIGGYNSCVLGATVSGGVDCHGSKTLVVPMLVYFDNGTGSDLVSRPGGIDPEVLVPPITLFGAKSNLVSASSQLQRASQLLDVDQLWEPGTASPTVSEAVADWRGTSVFVVRQLTKPGIAAPLGWALSEASMDAMDSSLADQKSVCQLSVGAPTKAAQQCRRSDEERPDAIGNLQQLLAVLDGR